MSAAPNVFQKHVYVRLPYSDAILRGDDDALLHHQLQAAFCRPLYTVPIRPHPIGVVRHQAARR